MSAFLFSDHEADDLVVRLPHAVLPEQADAADSALDVFHDDPVSALELLAVLVHVESQDAGVYGECNLSCAGCLGAVADNAGSDGKRIDHSVDDRLVIPAAEVSDTRACACSGADSSAVGGEGADAGLLVDGHQIGESMSAGRLYDKIGDKAEGKVVLVTERGVLCKVCKKSLAKQNGQAEE